MAMTMAMNHTGNVSSTANTNFHLATSNGENGGGSLELTQQLQHMKLSSMPKIPKRQPTIICEDIIDDDFGDDDEDENDEEDNLSLMGEPGEGGGAVGGGGDKVIRSASTASLTVPAVSDTDEKVEKRRPPLPTSQSDYNCAQ